MAERLSCVLALIYLSITATILPTWSSNHTVWDAVVAIAPRWPTAHYHLAVAEMQDGQTRQAVLDMIAARQLARSRPDLPWADCRFWIVMADQNLAMQAHAQGNTALAGDYLSEAYDLWPESFERPSAAIVRGKVELWITP